jgi:hypothetical protein
MARGGGDQAVEQVGVLDLIASAERLDDALDVAPALACVLDEVRYSYGPIFLTRINMARNLIAVRSPRRIVPSQALSITKAKTRPI